MVRMGDKIARINSLSRNKRQVGDESVADTFIDLYNYCIMALILICDSIEENKDPHRVKEKLSEKITSLRRDLESAKLEYNEVVKRYKVIVITNGRDTPE